MSFRGITPLTNELPPTAGAQQSEQSSGVAHTAKANLGATAPPLIGHAELSPAEQDSINDRFGKTCKHGDPQSVQALIDQGAQIDRPNVDGYTPLHEAVFGNNVEVVRLLLANGANINAKDVHGNTPLSTAAGFHKTEIIKMLLAHQADCGTALVGCMGFGSVTQIVATMRLLVDAGANIEAEDRLGWTPLARACCDSKTPIVAMLLDCGADPKVAFDQDIPARSTPLSYACNREKWDVVALLMMHAKGPFGRQPFAPAKLLDHCTPHFKQHFATGLRSLDEKTLHGCVNAVTCFVPAPEAAFILCRWIGNLPAVLSTFAEESIHSNLDVHLFIRGYVAYRNPALPPRPFMSCEDLARCADHLTKHFSSALKEQKPWLAGACFDIVKALMPDHRAAAMLACWYEMTVGIETDLTEAIHDSIRDYHDRLDPDTVPPDEVLCFALHEHSRVELAKAESWFRDRGLKSTGTGDLFGFMAIKNPDGPSFSVAEHGIEAITGLARGWAFDLYKKDTHWLNIVKFVVKEGLEKNLSGPSFMALRAAVIDLYRELDSYEILKPRAARLREFLESIKFT